MELSQAESMTRNLMRHYGVYDYEFSFMDRRLKYSRAGQCDYKKRLIQLQPTFVEKNFPVVVKWTIIHEIAHAIAGRKHGHNSIWKRTARLMGDDGRARYGTYVKR